MALSKISVAEERDVVQIVSEEHEEVIPMGIVPEGLSLILDRLTDLYSNPVEATVREIVSNAFDVTIILPLSRQKPVKITLPNNFNPAFSVQDFGDGMSLEVIKKIYSQYGGSTKSTDMRQTGAYGMGAKAPLSYCTEFTVESTHEGVTTIFNISRESTGSLVKILSSKETNKPSGTKVTIPVKLEDSDAFSRAVESYRKYSFDVEMEIDGVSSITDEYVVFDEEFPLEYDPETESMVNGRIWINKNSISKLIKTKFGSSYYYYNSISYAYVLSGWLYDSPHVNHYSRDAFDFIVELKPGVVDFSSPRDEVTNNSRSTRLNNELLDYFKNDSKSDLDRVMSFYRTLDNSKAFLIFKELFSSGKFVDEVLYLKFDPYSSLESHKAKLTVSDFETDNGYNPFEMLTKNYKKNLKAAFMASKEMFHVDGNLVENFEKNFDFNTSIFTVSKVTNGVNTIKNFYELVNPFVSFEEAVISDVLARQGPVYNKIVVVNEADSTSLGKILSGRRILSESSFANCLLVFGSTKSFENDVSEVCKSLDIEFDSCKASELIDVINFARKANRKVVVKDSDIMTLKLFCDETHDDEKEIIKKNPWDRQGKNYSLSEIMAENSLILLTKDRVVSTLIGVANSGVDITNRKIFFLPQHRVSMAKQLVTLSEYDHVYVGSDFDNKTKIAQKIRERGTFRGEYLDSHLNNVNFAVLVKSAFYRSYIPEGFFKNFAKFLTEEHSGEKSLLNLCESMSEEVSFSDLLPSITASDLKNVMSSDELNVLMGFRNGMTSVRSSHSRFNSHVRIEMENPEYEDYVKPIYEKLFWLIKDAISDYELSVANVSQED